MSPQSFTMLVTTVPSLKIILSEGSGVLQFSLDHFLASTIFTDSHDTLSAPRALAISSTGTRPVGENLTSFFQSVGS